MKDHQTLSHGFTWVPMDQRNSRLGGQILSRRQETRRPILWLARVKNFLYLVNDAQEPLDFVIAGSGGFMTIDNDNTSTVFNSEDYVHKAVQPGDAVKVEEYDDFYDLDYQLQLSLSIQSPQPRCVYVTTTPRKGGIGETVLLWDSGESGKDVRIRKCEEV